MSFRPIFGKPRLSQDWDMEQEERETHWTSLFYDLMIVAALNAIAEPFEEADEAENDENTFVLTPIRNLWLNAILQFLAVLGPWNFLNEYTSIISDESFIGHIAFFIHCFGLAATTAGCVGDLQENYSVLASGMILARLGLLVLYLRPLVYIDRARKSILTRCGTFMVTIVVMLWALLFLEGEEGFAQFRILLLFTTLWDYSSVMIMACCCLTREERIPLHINSHSDRIKEVTMVIFGEAIFAIILQPYSGAQPETHFYIALGTTLWLIYSMALQEFHMLPSEHEHAMRRSMLFGFLWSYSQYLKQIFLLGTSIGIKRAHLLMFRSPTEPVDNDTLNLIAWGLSMTMLMVVLIRSFSYGWGRHPSSNDPPHIYRLKMTWWLILTCSCILPQVLNATIVPAHPQPLSVLIAYGTLMTCIIIFETIISNKVAHTATLRSRRDGELLRLNSTEGNNSDYSSAASASDNASASAHA